MLSLIRALRSTHVHVSLVASLRSSDQLRPLPNRARWPGAASMLPEPPLQPPFEAQNFPSVSVARKSLLARSAQRRRSNAFFLYQHRSEEHTSELQSRFDLVCRLLLE